MLPPTILTMVALRKMKFICVVQCSGNGLLLRMSSLDHLSDVIGDGCFATA